MLKTCFHRKEMVMSDVQFIVEVHDVDAGNGSGRSYYFSYYSYY